MSLTQPDQTTIALIYDFDGTLAPGNMQEHSFLPDIGVEPAAFWREVGRLSAAHNADEVLIFMNQMLRAADAAGVGVRREDFAERGRRLELFPGVRDWFDLVDDFARARSLDLKHYLISSGNAEIIAGTPIAGRFHRVFASSYLWDEDGLALWPSLAVNYTTKTQFLFRINKDVLDVSDRVGVNRIVSPDDRAVPFENMIFIGDGETDVPCFRLVRDRGGLAIAVHDPAHEGAVAARLLADGRVDAALPADWREGGALHQAVAAGLEALAARARLRAIARERRPGGPKPA